MNVLRIFYTGDRTPADPPPTGKEIRMYHTPDEKTQLLNFVDYLFTNDARLIDFVDLVSRRPFTIHEMVLFTAYGRPTLKEVARAIAENRFIGNPDTMSKEEMIQDLTNELFWKKPT